MDLSTLVDERTGLVTSLERFVNPPEWPAALTITAAHVAHVGWDRTWHADRITTGTSFEGTERAAYSAVGEAIERYCANRIPGELTRASYLELTGSGRVAVDPDSLLLYSPEQYGCPEFPFVPFDRDLSVLWTEGQDMLVAEPVLVPASLVWVNYFHGPREYEPRTNFVVFAGVAAGVSRADAERSALEEVIERDAVEVWWHAGAPGIELDLTDRPDLTDALRSGDSDSEVLEYTALLVENRWNVPVVAVLVQDREYDLVTLGTAARPDVGAAVLKAAGEAVSLRSYAKGLLQRDGGPWQAVDLGLVDGTPLKPWRADRAYLDSYAADFAYVSDLSCQTQIYLDPRTRVWVEHLRRPQRRIACSDVAPVDGDPRRAYLSRLQSAGIVPVSVDLTTPDVRDAGVHAVRVIAPGTYTNAPAGFACLAGSRLREEPQQLGWVDRPLRQDELVLRPIPHT